MNKSKYTVITEKNLPFIAQRIEKWMKRHVVVASQSDWGWQPKWLNRMNLPDYFGGKHVEKTNVDYCIVDQSSFRLSRNYGFLIDCSKDGVWYFKIGDKIRITPSHIFYVEREHIYAKNRAGAKRVLWRANDKLEIALQQKHYDDACSDMYWMNVEAELLSDFEEAEDPFLEEKLKL